MISFNVIYNMSMSRHWFSNEWGGGALNYLPLSYSVKVRTRIEDCYHGYKISIATKITPASFCHGCSTGQM